MCKHTPRRTQPSEGVESYEEGAPVVQNEMGYGYEYVHTSNGVHGVWI